jgi:hypothetical protein
MPFPSLCLSSVSVAGSVLPVCWLTGEAVLIKNIIVRASSNSHFYKQYCDSTLPPPLPANPLDITHNSDFVH